MGVGVMGVMTLWDHGSNVCQLNAKGHLMMLSVGGGMIGMIVHDHPFGTLPILLLLSKQTKNSKSKKNILW